MSWNTLIIGLGQIGMGYDLELAPEGFVYSHARALSLHPEFSLIGAVDPRSRERGDFEKIYNAPAYESLESALENHAPDIVIIATPTTTHYELLLKVVSLAQPKVILCEKPLSYALDESREMVDVCAAKNIRLYVNYMRRSEPGVIEVKRRLDSGEISCPGKGVVWYSKGFLHNGSHLFNLLEYWLGEVQGFELVDSGRTLPDGDAEPDVYVSFKKGEMVFLAAKNENFSHNALELVAKNGRLRYENGGRYIEWREVAIDANLKGYTFLSPDPEEIRSELNRYQWYVVDQLAKAINGGKAQLCDGNHGMQTLEAMNLILESR